MISVPIFRILYRPIPFRIVENNFTKEGTDMAELIKIMLVEDEPMVCESYRATARNLPDLAITYETGSERQALDYLKKHKMDVIILDIELEEGDGASFLEKLAELDIEKPFITVVTNTASAVTLSFMREHGADYIYQKSNVSYSPSKVLGIIRKICPYQKMMKAREEPVVDSCFGREKDEELKRRYIAGELQKMGFKEKQVGFTYIVDAVLILMDYSGTPPHVTSEIYPLIAKERNTSKESVERSVRNAIERTFRHISAAQLNYYYPYAYDKEKGRPSNSDFLLNFSKFIRLC